ncbi:hypothetical protein BCV70DRAFT_21454 [Testicularia cyperi]|uniref:Uncharacterized protein n=1 Tax=Testicularia cyperi TaxID=1882483 RepID=A0A317XZX3_9BASI|nr:hypothetical protein BCV70DRAFT_21454 [Testicularia cyperi]
MPAWFPLACRCLHRFESADRRSLASQLASLLLLLCRPGRSSSSSVLSPGCYHPIASHRIASRRIGSRPPSLAQPRPHSPLHLPSQFSRIAFPLLHPCNDTFVFDSTSTFLSLLDCLAYSTACAL